MKSPKISSKIGISIALLSVVLFLAFTGQAGFAGLSAQTVVKKGSWDKVMYTVKGSWQIVKNGSKLQIILSKDFSTKNAPDLHIVFSPQEASKIESNNAMQGAKEIGFLKGKTSWGKLKGPITLDVPESVDISKYKSMIIQCIQYTETWAVAKL